jgi:hypothetical protein
MVKLPCPELHPCPPTSPRGLIPMADNGSDWWSWLGSYYFAAPTPAPARTSPVRRNTIPRAPPGHQTPTGFHYSTSGPLPVPSRPRKEINFYHKGEPYYEFTNFAPYKVTYEGKSYPTSEHLFQAFKVRPFGLTAGVCSL